jgi:hypothetical protein
MTAASECVSETLWKIKPLVWRDRKNFEEIPRFEAHTLLGTLVAREVPNGSFVATALSHMTELDDWEHKSIESAKQHCEAWYADKLRTALGGGAGKGEAIAKALRAFEHLRSQLEEYKNGDAVVFTDAAGCIAVIDEATAALRKGE